MTITPSRPREVAAAHAPFVLDLIIAGSLAVAILIALNGGFQFRAGPIRFSAHDPARPLLAGLVLLGLAFLLHKCAVRDAVEADRDASKAEALSDAREADERAHGAAETTRDAIERSNTDVKAAADGSDDPLRAGLDRLRADQDRDGKAARRAD